MKYELHIETRPKENVLNDYAYFLHITSDELQQEMVVPISEDHAFELKAMDVPVPGYFQTPEKSENKTETKGHTLYDQVKNYLLGTWSKSCVTRDDGQYFHADNKKRFVKINSKVAGNTFVEIREDGYTRTVFHGLIGNIDDFKKIMELVW